MMMMQDDDDDGDECLCVCHKDGKRGKIGYEDHDDDARR